MKNKWKVAGLLVCALSAFALGFQNSFQRSVEVFDGNNVLRSVIFANDDNGRSGLEIKDPNGNVRFSVHTNQQHDPFINFIDKNGKSRIEMGISPNGEAYLVMRRSNGTAVHTLVAPN